MEEQAEPSSPKEEAVATVAMDDHIVTGWETEAEQNRAQRTSAGALSPSPGAHPTHGAPEMWDNKSCSSPFESGFSYS